MGSHKDYVITASASLAITMMKFLVIDDHALIMEGLGLLLRQRFEPAEILFTDSAEVALDLISAQSDIDLIILDLSMPGMNGLAFLTALQVRKCPIPAVVVSATENIADIQLSLSSGARGFIPKSYAANNTLNALDKILEGQVYIPGCIQQQLNRVGQVAINANGAAADIPISKRQLDVLRLINDGLSNKDIAKVLNITESTIKSHVSILFDITQAKNRTECIARARQLHIL